MSNTLTRGAFEALSPRDRMAHVQSGGTVTDDPPASPRRLRPGEIARSAFDAMDHAGRVAVVRAGTPIVDVDE